MQQGVMFFDVLRRRGVGGARGEVTARCLRDARIDLDTSLNLVVFSRTLRACARPRQHASYAGAATSTCCPAHKPMPGLAR